MDSYHQRKSGLAGAATMTAVAVMVEKRAEELVGEPVSINLEELVVFELERILEIH